MMKKTAPEKMNPAACKYVGDTARDYDAKRNERPITGEDEKIINAFLDRCAPGSTVADIPAGTGRAVTGGLSRNFHYIGVDISDDMLRLCREKIGTNEKGTTFRADARDTPLADGQADYLLSIKFIKWLPEDGMVLDALREFRRVCRKQALINLKIKTSCSSEWREKLRNIAKRLVIFNRGGKQDSAKPKARALDPQKFEKLCHQAGWRVVERTLNPESNGQVWFYTLE